MSPSGSLVADPCSNRGECRGSGRIIACMRRSSHRAAAAGGHGRARYRAGTSPISIGDLNVVEMLPVNADALCDVSADLLVAAGLGEADATLAAEVLVTADLRGVDTHGAVNLLPSYLASLRSGEAMIGAGIDTVCETPATATLDGGDVLGVVTAPKAMAVAIEKARNVGIGVVVVRNSRHLAMAGYHAMLALEHDMVGMCATSAGPSVLPTFGAEPRLGTNPIAVAAPCSVEPHFVFDGATSAIAGNRITIAHRSGTSLPGGVIGDADGAPVREPSDPPPGYHGVNLLPLGSTPETGSHKGYGLAAVVEIMSTVLSGSRLHYDLSPGSAAHTLVAYDLAAFGEVADFKSTMDALMTSLTTTPPAPGHDRVLVPGQREWETSLVRGREGIPVPEESVQWFDGACREAGIVLLSERAGAGRGTA